MSDANKARWRKGPRVLIGTLEVGQRFIDILGDECTVTAPDPTWPALVCARDRAGKLHHYGKSIAEVVVL